ncbi:MAG: type II toxin-antitoxin system VapC family toxin [Promethearchaeota archaeon]|nr:MAG: type II toxin-antitoxin system VapC family toxin [Candidatus Lokiarchaeota archaeon]
MENQPIIFLDSNYWIYLFDQTTKEHAFIKNHFESIYGKYQLASNTVVLLETMHYLVKRLGSELVREKWKLFMAMDLIIDELTLTGVNAIFEEFVKYFHTGIGGRDASILASMKRLGNIQTLISHDQEFLKIPEIQVLYPIVGNILAKE